MASVTNDNARKYRHLGQEDEEPHKVKVVTLRDKILKQCLQRQLNTSISLQEQTKKKEFVKATVEESITNSTSGLLSSTDFQNLESKLSVNEILSASGLSKAEIKFLLDGDVESSSLESPHARELRLREIASKLSKRQDHLNHWTDAPEQFNGAFPLNRHEFEEECNAVPITDGADQLTACLVRLQPHNDESIPANHPINHIKELAQELFPDEEKEKEGNTHEVELGCKKRKASEDVPRWPRGERNVKDLEFMYFKEKPKSFWDMEKIPKFVVGCKPSQEGKVVGCKPNPEGKRAKIDDCTRSVQVTSQKKKCSVDKTKPFVLSLDPSDLVPLQDIYSNRKSVQEIKSMEKFKSYDAGEPSQTLYLKNLPHKMSPRDLASIVGHFDSQQVSKIVYRILDGRMKGQAFVTFQDVSVATKALNTCNGYILHDKPIVIAFGKK